MRILGLLFALLLISSCGMNRLRFTKAEKSVTERPIATSSISEEKKVSTFQSQTNIVPEAVTELPEVIALEEEEITSENNSPERKKRINLRSIFPNSPTVVTDTVRVESNADADYIARKAKSAERMARSSVILSIAFPVLLVTTSALIAFTGDFIIIFLGLLVLALACYFASIGLFIGAQSSRYITERGNRLRVAAMIMVIINTVWLLAVLLLSFFG